MEHPRNHRHNGPVEPGYPAHPETAEHGRRAPSEHGGHDKHTGHSVEMFRDRFWVCLALTVPALVWEPMLQEWFG